MTAFRPNIADILVTLVVLAGQILIARLFFFSRREPLRPAAARFTIGILPLLWATMLFASPYRFFTRVPLFDLVPYGLKNVLFAIGNGWGIVSVLSLGVFWLFRAYTRHAAIKHSPDRLLPDPGCGTVGSGRAPFAAAAFGPAIVERTQFFRSGKSTSPCRTCIPISRASALAS